MSLTFGRVPHPDYLDHPITKVAGVGRDPLMRQRTVKGVVWHRMIGTLLGTDAFFHDPTVAALTDYGVGTTGTDGAANNGVIIRFNNPLGKQIGWASGSWDAAHAFGDGEAFVNKYGIDAINGDQTAIEISGVHYDDPITPECKQSVAAITAYWADQYKIPWNAFPIAPQDGFSFVRWHREFGPEHGTKMCPGSVVENATPEMIDMVKAILKAHQEDAITNQGDTFQKPVGLPFDLATATGWQKLNGLDVLMVDFTDECIKDAIPRSYASTKAPQSAAKIKVKDLVQFKGVFIDTKKVGWRLMADGSRIRSSSFHTNLTAKKR